MRFGTRRWTRVTLGVLAATTLAACGLPGGGGSEEEGAGNSGALDVNADGSDWTGTITMFAQGYTPHATVANSDDLSAMQTAADAYEEDHPGIEIQFVDEKFDIYTDTVRLKAAAGELWDVYWGQWAALNGSLPRGIAYDLSPAFAVKNKYAPDADTWADAMNPGIIAATKAPNGASYNINGDYVLTGWYYNQDLLTQAGITTTPTTWGDFIAACDQLKAAGITPVAYVPYYGWMQRHFLSDIYSTDFDKISMLDGSPGYSVADEAQAVATGVLSPADPRFMSWWPAFKESTDTWQSDYVNAPSERNDRAEQDFFAGKAAMYYSGSWLPSKLDGANVPFDWGVFPFPKLDTATIPDARGTDTSNVVGGPTGAYQYAMATPQADRTMSETGKPEAVLDWMRYIGSGSVASDVVNEAGQFVPTFTGAEVPAKFADATATIEQPLTALVVNFMAPNLDTDQQRIFGSYLAGDITLDEASSQMSDLLTKAADDYMAANPATTAP